MAVWSVPDHLQGWILTLVVGIATGTLADGQGLSGPEFAVERRMLDEVPDDHVPAPAGQARAFDVFCGELSR